MSTPTSHTIGKVASNSDFVSGMKAYAHASACLAQRWLWVQRSRKGNEIYVSRYEYRTIVINQLRSWSMLDVQSCWFKLARECFRMCISTVATRVANSHVRIPMYLVSAKNLINGTLFLIFILMITAKSYTGAVYGVVGLWYIMPLEFLFQLDPHLGDLGNDARRRALLTYVSLQWYSDTITHNTFMQDRSSRTNYSSSRTYIWLIGYSL